MTPEELNELRKSAAMVTQIGIHNAEICKHPYNGVNNASFALVNLPGLLAHIDQQAAQIEALKEKLVEATAKEIYPFNMPQWENLPEEDCWKDNELFGKSRQVGKATYRYHARQQLAEEMPEVDWQ